jgi:hypothetical protein
MTKQNDMKTDSTQVLENSGDSTKKALLEAIDFVKNVLGNSSFDEGWHEDFKFLNHLEEVAGVKKSSKNICCCLMSIQTF